MYAVLRITAFNNYTQHDTSLGTAKNFQIPSPTIFKNLYAGVVGMFEWAVISKRSFEHNGACLENMPIFYFPTSSKYYFGQQGRMFSLELVKRFSEIKV